MQTIIGSETAHAAAILQQGNLVAIPTETVYGLAANALNEAAVAKIFEAKQRPTFNPLIVHIGHINQIQHFADVDELSMELCKQFMPGPFTILLPKKNIIPDLVTAGSTKVAIRMPKHALTLELLQQIDFPLAAPSANPFGYVSPTTAQHVYEGLNGKIPYILDGGPCTVGVESTIVEVIEGKVYLHRNGGISSEQIEEFIQQPLLKAAKNSQEKPMAPGQLKSHYATNTPLIVGNVEALLEEHRNQKVAIISFSTHYESTDLVTCFELSPNNNLSEAAQKLFAVMRYIDTQQFDIVIAEFFPEEGLGHAINDRLHRAQSVFKAI